MVKNLANLIQMKVPGPPVVKTLIKAHLDLPSAVQIDLQQTPPLFVELEVPRNVYMQQLPESSVIRERTSDIANHIVARGPELLQQLQDVSAPQHARDIIREVFWIIPEVHSVCSLLDLVCTTTRLGRRMS